jgi:hypothetical protein
VKSHSASLFEVVRSGFDAEVRYGAELMVAEVLDVRFGGVTLTQQQQHLSSSLAFMQARS